ncbi:hypothetical protein CEXT_737061 [Caerostris extrusa]|uniref:Uncharacterized protein n=1 Tax=Caerostris extrusa TaxID=172846 RepID=A0AAV4X2D0_CAEEX|nr:hypothetical protein CEXT_737061 [Caerostris extrusa]
MHYPTCSLFQICFQWFYQFTQKRVKGKHTKNFSHLFAFTPRFTEEHFPFSNSNTPSAPTRADHKRKTPREIICVIKIHFWKCPTSQKGNPNRPLSRCLKSPKELRG